jgi:osmotically-inducible protein OsmY
MLRTRHRCDPSRLRKAVLDAMAGTTHTDDRVEASASTGGIVTLTGTVRSAAQRHRLASVVWTAPGVEEVINQLRVER